MEKEFKIIVNKDGTERIEELSPFKQSCKFCGAKITVISAEVYNGACKTCHQKNPQNWFCSGMVIIPLSDIPKNQSIFGNHFYEITKSQIEELLNGGVLYSDGEYGTFIKLMEE